MSQPSEDPLYIHNIRYGNCNVMGDNRYRNGSLYCWRSRVVSEPECVTASICSPVSYTDARDRFCRAYGGMKDMRYGPGNPTCDPDLFVSNLPGEDPRVMNIRGANVLDNRMCDGIAGRLKCAAQGIGQSIRGQQPSQLFIHVGLALGALLIAALVIRYTGVGKELKKLKIFDTRALKPKRGK